MVLVLPHWPWKPLKWPLIPFGPEGASCLTSGLPALSRCLAAGGDPGCGVPREPSSPVHSGRLRRQPSTPGLQPLSPFCLPAPHNHFLLNSVRRTVLSQKIGDVFEL